MASSNVYISKLGLTYEDLYYYKQKVVNWDFVAPSYYSTEFTPFQYANSANSTLSLDLKGTNQLGKVSISTYITEQSYANNQIYYVIEIDNNLSPSIPLILEEYANTNKNTEIFDISTNIPFTQNYSYTTTQLVQFTEDLPFPNTINDSIYTKVFSKFPIGTYGWYTNFTISGMNLVLDFLPIPISIIPNYKCADLSFSLVLSKDIFNIGISLETITNEINTYKQYVASSISISGEILPISTEYAIGNDIVLGVPFWGNAGIYAISDFALLNHTSIVHV